MEENSAIRSAAQSDWRNIIRNCDMLQGAAR